MGTSVSAFPCPCFCDIIRVCESMNVPLSECKEIHFSVKSNRFQGHWINDAQHWLNLAQLAPFRIRKNAVPLHSKSATSMTRHNHLAVGSQLIRPKADYVCSQEHSKVSFQLLGMFPVTRKAPQTATLGIFLRSRDAVAWNQKNCLFSPLGLLNLQKRPTPERI